ncbi:rab-GTPase-TBC domain-domain-containing protein [Absidia repens]|uniref:Rab-GTPase-TBC domain-domain-containing protein n=1 Tax=Absidia repens TaxID=90262 RepID=A0A1X2IDY4_9FUNG|nr:rab-GTPase-TBC domain-domain-containing protein [Absidia repens]
MSSSQLLLAPEVLNRLHQLQQADRPVSVDEILHAANLNHLALPVQQPTQSKSAEIPRMTKHQHDSRTQNANTVTPLRLEKSTSTLTLAERRHIPVTSEKLTLDTSIPQLAQGTTEQQKELPATKSDSSFDHYDQLEKLEIENAKMSAQVSIEYFSSHLERQNAILQSESNSVSMKPNQLKAEIDTIWHMMADNNSECQINQINTNLSLESPTPDGNLDWELWQCLVDDYPTAAVKQPYLISAIIRNGGIPQPLRCILWQAMTQSFSQRLETVYEDLVNGIDGSFSPYAQVIQRDLSHIFATVEMFKGDSGRQIQPAMGRLLTSYSAYDSQVGYSQGLVFLAGPLLMTIPEKQAFCVFVRLMETHEMRTMFILNKQRLHLRLYQFQTLLLQLCPLLNAHLTRHSISPVMYAGQWFLTLFASVLPLHIVVRIYDLAFAEGAVDTMTRVAITMMQKNEKALLNMEDSEQILMYLSTNEFYEAAYQSDAEALILDVVALSNSITKTKMENIAAAYDKDLGSDNVSAHQLLSIEFGGRKANGTRSNINANSKRNSWFPWKVSKTSTTTISTLDHTPTTPVIPLLMSSSPTNFDSQHHHDTECTEHMLRQQAEELVDTLSQLQKDHSHLTDQVNALKLDAIGYTAVNKNLVEHNSVLTRRLDNGRQEDRQFSSTGQYFESPSFSSTPYAAETNLSSLVNKTNDSRLQVLEQDQEFCSFVSSLRSTGDFGTLIASALSTSTTYDVTTGNIRHPRKDCIDNYDQENGCQNKIEDVNGLMDTMDSPRSAIEIEDATAITAATNHGDYDVCKLDASTQELLAMKLANFELGQKYDDMCDENESLKDKLALSHNKEQMYLDQMAVLEKVREDQAQEIDTMVNANERLSERIMAVKQTSAELHMEKLTLMEQRTQLETEVSDLKREKQEYLMPRDSFSEEVFAAHHTLFGEGSVFQKQQQQKHHVTNPTYSNNGNDDDCSNNDYQRKYVDSEIRCRELEKLLAETKVKLVEYEASPAPTQKRPTSFAAIRGSGNSNIHGLVLMTRGAGIGSTAMTRDDSAATRASIDSMSTTASSKRSSVYSRLWNSISTPTTPSSTDVLPFSNDSNNSNNSGKSEAQYQSPTIVHSEFTPI